jgi:DNA-binding PadR family transcriptional regulator
MNGKRFLGELEQMVLLAVLLLREEAYGVTIRRELEERAGRSVTRGALYTTLERLEAKGYLASSMGDPTPQRGGRSKRFFQVTSEGVSALKTSREAMEELWRGAGSILEKAP